MQQLLPLLSCLLLTTLSAPLLGAGSQLPDPDTIPAYLPEGSVRVDKQYPDKPGNRYLYHIYGNIFYPPVPRAMGVTGVVKIDYTISEAGMLRIDTAVFFSQEALLQGKDAPGKSDILMVTAYRSSGPTPTPAPVRRTAKRQAAYERRLRSAEEKLVAETVRVFSKLPRFEPASVAGRPVAQGYTRYVVFRME